MTSEVVYPTICTREHTIGVVMFRITLFEVENTIFGPPEGLRAPLSGPLTYTGAAACTSAT